MKKIINSFLYNFFILFFIYLFVFSTNNTYANTYKIENKTDFRNNVGKYFINLIPIAGAIWYIVLLCQPSLPNA